MELSLSPTAQSALLVTAGVLIGAFAAGFIIWWRFWDRYGTPADKIVAPYLIGNGVVNTLVEGEHTIVTLQLQFPDGLGYDGRPIPADQFLRILRQHLGEAGVVAGMFKTDDKQLTLIVPSP